MSYLDLTDVDAPKSMGPMPVGEYLVSVVNAEEKTSQAGNEYLNLEFHVMQGPYEGRRIYEVFNIKHPKDEVRQIALEKLKGLVTAAGSKKLKLSGPDSLCGMTALASVKIKEEYNKISHFLEGKANGKAKASSLPKTESSSLNDDDEELPF